MKIILEGKEADRYLLAIKLYDLHIAFERFDKLNLATMWSKEESLIDYYNMLTGCLQAYLEECAYLKEKERKEHTHD